jgi:hypothetical protein
VDWLAPAFELQVPLIGKEQMIMNTKKLNFKPVALAHAVLTAVLLSAAGTSYAQAPADQTLCCDKNAQGKCMVPMPNRPSPSRVGELKQYGDLLKRLDKLDTGSCSNSYFLNKAQAWLNLSRDLHHEGDGSAASNATYEEAEKLVKVLEEGKTPSLDTAMIQNADKLRTDLWDMAAARKATPALLSSAAREVAYCEVYLVRAGHAQANLGGKARVEPLVGMAQDICQAAKDKAPCPVVAPVEVKPTPAPVVAPVIVAPAPVVITPAPVIVPQVAPKRKAKQDRH